MPAAFLLLFTFLFSQLGWTQSFCVIKSKAILYESASNRSKEVLSLEKWTPLQGVGKPQKGFRHVKTSRGVLGWVRTSQVTEGKSCVAVRVDRSRLRSGPGTEFEARELAQRGDVFLDLGGEDGWTKVQDDQGKEAWINLDHLWRPHSKMRMSFDAEP